MCCIVMCWFFVCLRVIEHVPDRVIYDINVLLYHCVILTCVFQLPFFLDK